MSAPEVDFERRFAGIRRLYGDEGLARFRAAHVCVIGLGGVGSWAAEALARSAIGKLTLIDLDNVTESNVNRQLHALDGEFGKAKVTAIAERIRLINPLVEIHELEDFISPENIAELFKAERKINVVLDAIDDARAKTALAAYCREKGLPLVVTGAAGGRLDPTRVRSDDMALVSGDRLLAKVRNSLRRDHGFPKGIDGGHKKPAKFGIPCVYSNEPVVQPDAVCVPDQPRDGDAITGLNCAGYGSSICVTSTFGMAAAALVLNQLQTHQSVTG